MLKKIKIVCSIVLSFFMDQFSLLQAESFSLRTFKKESQRENIVSGIVHVNATFNNTVITILDGQGNLISWVSAGNIGFKGSRKSRPFAAQLAVEDCVRKAIEHGIRKVSVFVRGPGSGRETAIRALQKAGLEISYIRDVTPVSHNGCRPPKRRRV